MAQMGDIGTVCHVTERLPFLKRESRVTIQAAEALTGVPVATIRSWAEHGALVIERRGDLEVVTLDHVRSLAARRQVRRRDTLRHRLDDADRAPAPTLNVQDLQQLAIDRTTQPGGRLKRRR